MEKEVMFKVGDKVYFIQSFDEIYPKDKNRPIKTKHPMEKKITQIVVDKEGVVTYQVKGGHFSNNWINVFVFTSSEAASEAIKKRDSK